MSAYHSNNTWSASTAHMPLNPTDTWVFFPGSWSQLLPLYSQTLSESSVPMTDFSSPLLMVFRPPGTWVHPMLMGRACRKEFLLGAAQELFRVLVVKKVTAASESQGQLESRRVCASNSAQKRQKNEVCSFRRRQDNVGFYHTLVLNRAWMVLAFPR